jgi:hypothetical protein
MAYMNQDRKAQRAPIIKAILKKYNVKGSLSVRNHSTLVLTIKSGAIDFIGNYNEVVGNTPRYMNDPLGFRPVKDSMDINPYWYQEHFTGKAKDCLKEVLAAMYGADYFDDSDIQTDYFHCSHYVDVNIGKWNKPYILEK